jgi:hypothetical protein
MLQEQLEEDRIMPRIPFAVLGGVLGFALLTGCAGRDQGIMGGNEPQKLAFECDADMDFTASLSGDREEARVDVGDTGYELNLTSREDGNLVYSNEDGVELTVGEDDAYLRIPGDPNFENCERV